MIERSTPIIHAFGGSFFEIAIFYCLIPPHYRTFVRVRVQADGPEIFGNGIECSEQQLRELSALTKTARELVAFLQEGGKVENWGKTLHDWRPHHGN